MLISCMELVDFLAHNIVSYSNTFGILDSGRNSILYHLQTKIKTSLLFSNFKGALYL